MLFGKKLTALCLAGAMAVGMAGCQTGQDTKYVATIGEQQVPAGVYLTMLQQAYSQVIGELAEPGENPLNATTADGAKASDAIAQEAKDLLAQYIATEQKFAEMNLTLSDNDNATTDYMLEMYWGYNENSLTANGVAKDSYRMYLDNMAKQNVLFKAIYGEGGTEEVPEADLKAYFQENYKKLLVVQLTPSTEPDANVYEEETAKYEENLALFEAAVKDGKSMEETYLQYLKNGAEAPENITEEQVKSAYTYLTKEQSNYDETVTEAMLSAAEDKITKLEGEDGSTYYFQRYSIADDEDGFQARTATILDAMRNTEFYAKLTEWGTAALGDVTNQAALNRYTADKLVFPS